jgi:hypothetical protein
MKLKLRLNSKGALTVVDFDYSGDLEKAKRELALISYRGVSYEWVSYDRGYYPYDWVCEFGEYVSDYSMGWQYPYQIPYVKPSCECGKVAANAIEHSFWCPAWENIWNSKK